MLQWGSGKKNQTNRHLNMEVLRFEAALLFLCGICIKGPCVGNILYPSFRNRNFWLEYSTPPTTLYPEYDDFPEASTTPEPGPMFAEPFRNHSVRQTPIGTTVFLDCKVDELMDYQVSWFRRQNNSLSVLTIGRETFSADDRYALALTRPNNWRLKIRPTLQRDNGTYLCQVSTHPPIVLITHLKVIVPQVHLIDEDRRQISEKHYKPGSTIELHCFITDYLPEFKQVLWTKEGKVMDQDSERGGISVKTKLGNGTVSSILYLATATASDSGIYSCNVANLAKAQLSLHVTNGEEPAAIQSSGCSDTSSSIALMMTASLLSLRG